MTESAKQRNYIFGYGSLICPQSRAITAPEQKDKVATPVQVRGVQRIWNKTAATMTAMGATFAANAECVGVVLPCSVAELKKFDRRERGYTRVQLPLEDIFPVPFLSEEEHLRNDRDGKGETFFDVLDDDEHEVLVWMYVPMKPNPPKPNFPIAQSYVDVILRGCLHIHEEFAKEFIRSTAGWASPKQVLDEGSNGDVDYEIVGDGNRAVVWLDDRDDPLYARADPGYSRKMGRSLDRLLQKHRPEHFRVRASL